MGSYTPVFTSTEGHPAAFAPAISMCVSAYAQCEYAELRNVKGAPDSGLSGIKSIRTTGVTSHSFETYLLSCS